MLNLMTTSLIILCSMLIPTPAAAEYIAKDPKSVSDWFQKLSLKKEKVTEFHFYFHDIQSGKKPSAVPVARANSTDSSPNLFGLVYVMDDPLTVGPDPESEIVGRAQGIYASSAVTGDLAYFMTMTLVFTRGLYNGSTLSLSGRNPVLDTYREMPIIGGSGVFRVARGVATAKTISFTVSDAIVEYHVVVMHY